MSEIGEEEGEHPADEYPAEDGAVRARELTTAFFFLPILLASLGGLSLLSLAESALQHDFNWIQPIQWLMDGYHRIANLLSLAIEPIVEPALSWVRSTFSVDIHLAPFWRPYFTLELILVAVTFRSMMGAGMFVASILSGVLAVVFLLVALGVGLLPTTQNPMLEPVVAIGIPLAIWVLGLPFAAMEKETLNWLGGGALGIFLLFAISVGICVLWRAISGSAAGSGVFTFAVWLGLFGAGIVAVGYALPDKDVEMGRYTAFRVGWAVLGGFVAALIIWLADFLVKIMSG